MATAPVTVINFNPGSLTSPFTSASFTPTVSTKLVVFGVAARNAVITTKPTISDNTAGVVTWTEMGNNKTSTFSNPDLWVVGWISNSIASASAMTISITNAGANAVAACILSVLDADTDGTVVQVAYGEDLANGDPSSTFGATPGTSHIVIGCNWMGGGNAITKPTSYINLFDNTPSALTARRAECFYAISSAPKGPNQSTSTNIRGIVMAVELGFGGNITVMVTGPSMTASVGSVTATAATGATLNPYDKKSDLVLLSNSNYTVTGTDSDGNNWVRSTIAQTGKRYAEFTIDTVNNTVIGISDTSALTYPGADVHSFGMFSNGSGAIAGSFPTWGPAYTTGNVLGMAFDPTAKKVWYRVGAGAWNAGGTADPVTGVGGYDTSTYTGTTHYLVVSGNNGMVTTVNFGLIAFANTAPSGYASWNGSSVISDTETVTGQSVTASVGTVTVAAAQTASTAVTSPASTAQVGTVIVLTPALANVTVTGQQVTASVGTVTVNTTVFTSIPVTQTEMTGYVGTVNVLTAANVNIPVTMGGSTALVGTVTVAAGQIPIVGVTSPAMTASVGTVTVTTKSNVIALVTSPTMTAAVGAVTVATRVAMTVSVTGLSVTVSVGVVTIPGASTARGAKVWNGTTWVNKPVKAWSGSVWVQKSVKVWHGSAWG